MKELLIQSPDGQTRVVPLTGDRLLLGRSSSTQLCFPDDAGLSRQHLMLERDGSEWTVQDLGSKNGTLVNNVALKGRVRLKSGDRIGAGHLVMIYDVPAGGAEGYEHVVVFQEPAESEPPSTSTFVTSLEGALSGQTIIKDTGSKGAAHVQALIKAGIELAGNRPLEDLFPLILDLAIEAVGAQRGVVMTLENEHLRVQAHKGEGFRISSAVRIEHARLAEIEAYERMITRELQQAAEIQSSLLPTAAPQVSGADIAGYNQPCRTVGGDYYDFFNYENGRVALLLGDVSGNGLPASLLMMGLQARVQVLADEPQNVAAVMTRLNKGTCANCPSNRFITLFMCILDPASGELVYANAGHNPPVLVRADGKTEFLDGGGPVLGIVSAACYQEYRARMDPGDLLVLYSDGVTEATSPAEEEFGEERFAQILCGNRHRPASEIVSVVTKALAEWAAGSPPADDVTLVIARRLESAA